MPRQTVAEQDAEYGPRLHDRDPNLCCFLRKVEPLARNLEGRGRVGHRRTAGGGAHARGHPRRRLGRQARPGQGQPAGRLDATSDVEAYQVEHDLPRNPLTLQGYPSIGCAPCTRRVAPGEDPRAGRWSGKDKTECGIHT